jgi:hypothetical protein
MEVFVGRLPNPQGATPRRADNEKVLAKVEKIHQHQQLLLPLGGGIGFLPHQQLRYYVIVAFHRGNSPNTLWVVGARGDAGEDNMFSNARVRDGGGVGVGYNGDDGDGDSEGWEADPEGA